jgi:predicted molibdopterin-dependent oxidoreductase YjgC
MWIQGEDVVQSDPNTAHVEKALSALEFLVVQELFMTDTARMAHVVFPAASVLEQEGTFTNGERRIQHVRPAVQPPAGARPDWEVIRDVAHAMGGLGARWSYPTPASVMDELALVVPHLFGGVSYDRLAGDGLQWPCPTATHPGTRTLHTDTFVRGRAAFMSVDFSPPLDPAAPDFPFVLMTGRILEHYNVGTMTRRTPNRDLAPRDCLELHAEDARRLGVADGSPVRITSRFGTTTAPARISRRIAPGTTFLTFHFPETRTNCVIGPAADPTSKCPDYKVIAVALAPA